MLSLSLQEFIKVNGVSVDKAINQYHTENDSIVFATDANPSPGSSRVCRAAAQADFCTHHYTLDRHEDCPRDWSEETRSTIRETCRGRLIWVISHSWTRLYSPSVLAGSPRLPPTPTPTTHATTHPSHPAANAIQMTLKDAQRGYADMHGSWNHQGLRHMRSG